jgi:hypothetical protein
MEFEGNRNQGTGQLSTDGMGLNTYSQPGNNLTKKERTLSISRYKKAAWELTKEFNNTTTHIIEEYKTVMR